MTKLDEVLAQTEGWPVDTLAVGVSDRERTLATHGPTDAVLPFASLTKPLSAYAVLIAAYHGRLDLDEPAGPDEAPDGITVRHLLAHASGLPLDPGGLVGVPEAKRIYSNWGYALLGALVEERTDMSFAEHLDLEVLQPLHMNETVLEGSPAAGARGTVDDLLAFVRELLAPTLLSDELHATATSVAFPGLEGVVPGFGRQTTNDWGLGFEIKDAKDPHWTGDALPADTFGHFGRSGSFLWVDPGRGVGAAELADRDFGDWSKQHWPGFQDAIVAALDEPADA